MFEELLLAASVWITPVAAPPDAAPLARHVAVGLDSWQRPDVWSVPVYEASAQDPRRPLLYNAGAWAKVASGAWQRYGNSAKVEAEIVSSSKEAFPFEGNVYSTVSRTSWQLPARFNATQNPGQGPASFHLAEAMLPAPGPDGHMAVRQPDGRVLETYATIRLSSGTTVALSYAVTDPRRSGDGFENGQTASMLPVHLGLLDERSVQAGAIGHALAITLPARLLAPEVAHPAYTFDRGAMSEEPPYSGTIAMGARLVLPAGLNLDALELQTAPGRVIAAAARRYGFIVVDRGGAGISLRVRRNDAADAGSPLRAWNAPLARDLAQIFERLVIVPAAEPLNRK
jgi:hypothetical protein